MICVTIHNFIPFPNKKESCINFQDFEKNLNCNFHPKKPLNCQNCKFSNIKFRVSDPKLDKTTYFPGCAMLFFSRVICIDFKPLFVTGTYCCSAKVTTNQWGQTIASMQCKYLLLTISKTNRRKTFPFI